MDLDILKKDSCGTLALFYAAPYLIYEFIFFCLPSPLLSQMLCPRRAFPNGVVLALERAPI